MKSNEKIDIKPITIRSYQHLGNTIRRVRKLLAVSQGALAKKAGVTQTTISNVETAKTSAEIETIILIFAALDLDMVVKLRPKDGKKNSLEGLF